MKEKKSDLFNNGDDDYYDNEIIISFYIFMLKKLIQYE